MRYFRSPELAFWATAVVALIALTIFAASAGGRAAAGGRSTVPVGAPAATSSQARPQVDALLALMPAGIAAGTSPTSLTNFATSVGSQAQQGATIRTAEGATPADALLTGFSRTAQDAQQLSVHRSDPVAATALRTQIGLDVDHLHRLVLGQPAPDLPAAGLDPFAGSDSPPQAPTPMTPVRPATPTLGAKP